MNTHNFKDQSNKGKALLLLTYPLTIGVHYMEWHRMRKLQRMIRKWISVACKNPNGHEAEMVKEWSYELNDIYGK